MDAYTLCLELFPAGHVCALPPIFFPLCFNYHRTPAFWLNYVPALMLMECSTCTHIPVRKGKR